MHFFLFRLLSQFSLDTRIRDFPEGLVTPEGGAPTYYFENERIWTEGARVPGTPLWIRRCQSKKFQFVF